MSIFKIRIDDCDGSKPGLVSLEFLAPTIWFSFFNPFRDDKYYALYKLEEIHEARKREIIYQFTNMLAKELEAAWPK